MSRSIAILSALFLAFAGANAKAGVFTEDLSKCLVKSTNDADRKDLVIWLFTIVASHPDAKGLTTITKTQQEALSRSTATLMQRLVTQDCRKETVGAIKYEGSAALESPFAALGEMAMTGLMGHPDVAAGLEGPSKYFDAAAFDGLAKDVSQLPSVPPK